MDKVQKIKELFSDIAKQVVDEYKTDIAAGTALRGDKLSFEELKTKTFELDRALRDKAVKLIELYKKETQENGDVLIEDFRVIINSSLELFIKSL